MERRALQERTASSMNVRKKVSLKQRSTKQMMEKKRRARINNCLESLKTIVLKNSNQDVSQFSKLEKADILEMAVKYMEEIQKSKSSISQECQEKQKPPLNFETGYQECATQVMKLVETHQPNGSGKERTRFMDELQKLSSAVSEKENTQPQLGGAPSEHSADVSFDTSGQEDLLRPGDNFDLPELNPDILADLDYSMATSSSNLWRPW